MRKMSVKKILSTAIAVGMFISTYTSVFASGMSNSYIPTTAISYSDVTPNNKILVGDVNSDGEINGKDSTLVARYIAGWTVTVDKSAADINGDGKIDGKDSTLIRRYIAGWNIVNSLISPDDATTLWKSYLSSESYSTYTDDFPSTSLEYVIMDLNADTIPELLIQSPDRASFYNTWLFAINNNKEPVMVYDTYGYGSFRYSAGSNAIIVSPEFKPSFGTSYSPFYRLTGTQLDFLFEIGQDSGESYYSDSNGEKKITDAERESYYDDITSFDWKNISSLNTVQKSQKPDLSVYIGTNIWGFIEMIGNMHDDGPSDGSKQYSNGSITVGSDRGSDTISFVSINGDCEYSINGIEYGMPMSYATSIAYESSLYVSDDSPYYKRFAVNNEVTLSVYSENTETVSGISLFL